GHMNPRESSRMNSGISVREFEGVFRTFLKSLHRVAGWSRMYYACPRIFDNHAVIFGNDCVLMTSLACRPPFLATFRPKARFFSSSLAWASGLIQNVT